MVYERVKILFTHFFSPPFAFWCTHVVTINDSPSFLRTFKFSALGYFCSALSLSPSLLWSFSLSYTHTSTHSRSSFSSYSSSSSWSLKGNRERHQVVDEQKWPTPHFFAKCDLSRRRRRRRWQQQQRRRRRRRRWHLFKVFYPVDILLKTFRINLSK